MKRLQTILLAFAGMLFLSASGDSQNLLKNGNFEVGLRNWTYHTMLTGKESYGIADFAIKPEIDLTSAASGKASVKAAIPAGIYNEELHKVYFWFRSGLAEVKPDTTYTLSFYGKSSKDVRLEARVYDGFKIYTFFISAGLNLGTEWKRYSFSGKSIGKFAWVEIANWKCDGCTWWIDGVQLEEGDKASDFKPAREVEAGCESARAHNIYKPGEKVDVKISLSKSDNKAGEYEIAYATEEALTGKTLGEKKETASFQENNPRIEKSMPYELATNRKGIFKTTVTVTDKKIGKVIDFDEYIYGVYDPLPRSDRFREDSIFAVDHLIGGSNNRDSVEEYFRMASEIGVRWFRNEDYRFCNVNPAKGVFHFDDSLLKVIDKYKVGQMITLGVELGTGYIPKWARTEKTTKHPLFLDGKGNILYAHAGELGRTVDLDALYGYANETVKHLKGKVKYWEVFNESYGYPEYPDYLKTVNKAIKDADPQAITIMNIMHCEKAMFEKRVKEKEEYKDFDVLSYHIYAMPQPTTAPEYCIPSLSSVFSETRAALKNCGVDKPIWDTEGGYFAKSYYTERMVPLSFIKAQLTEGWLGQMYPPDTVSIRENQVLAAAFNTRKYILYMHENIGKFFHFVFNHLGSIGPYCSLIEYDDTPKLSYLAYGQLARMLEAAKPVKKLALGEKVAGYIFEKDSRLVTTIWNLDNKDAEYRVALGALKGFDMVGNELTIKQDKEKSFLPISGCPIYIVTEKTGSEEVAKAFESGEVEGLVPIAMGIELAKDPSSKKPAVALLVKNVGVKDFSGDFQVIGCPKEWKLAKDTLSIEGLKRSSMEACYFPFDELTAQQKPVCLRVMHKIKGEILDVGREFPRIALCEQNTGKIKIDGKLDSAEWSDSPECKIDSREHVVLDIDEETLAQSTKVKTWSGPQDLSGDVYVRWSQDALYLGAKIKCRNFIQNKTVPGKIFNSTCVEVFLSLDPLKNAWDICYKPSDYHLLFSPKTADNPKYLYFGVRDMNKEIQLKKIEMASEAIEGGYAMEVKIPFDNFEELRDLKDKENLVIGFDIAIDSSSKKGDRQYQMAWAGIAGNCARVDQFARLIFTAKKK